MRNSHVSIIINLTEHDARLPRLLQSLSRQEEQISRAEILLAAPENLPIQNIPLWQDILKNGSIRIHPLPPEVETAEARNKAISESSGEYILCLRPDYRLDPKYLATTLPELDTNAASDVVYGDFIRLQQNHKPTVKSGYAPLPDFSNDLLRTSNILGPAVVFRRIVWEDSDGFRSNTVYSEWDFWVQAALRGYAFTHIPYPLSSCDNRSTTFRERAEDARGKAMVVINNQAYFHMHTVRWAMAYLRGDSWASTWAFMRLPNPMDVSKMMLDHNIQRMGGSLQLDKALQGFTKEIRAAKTI